MSTKILTAVMHANNTALIRARCLASFFKLCFQPLTSANGGPARQVWLISYRFET